MKRRWRYWAICAAIVIGSTVAARFLSNVRFFQLLNLKALDAHFVLRGQVPTSNIVLFVVDKKALDTFPEPTIFWHLHYAEGIRAAAEAGAKVIGLDHAFAIPIEKWEPDYDRTLAEAAITSPVPVVCGYVSALNAAYQVLPIQIEIFARAQGLSAFANLTSDPDDFVRRQELIETTRPHPNEPTDNDLPPEKSFALRVAEKYLGADASPSNGRLALNGRPIPISPERTVFINYAGGPGTFKERHSLADVIAAARSGRKDELRNWVNGKIVLIGADNIVDRYATPFYTLFSGPNWT